MKIEIERSGGFAGLLKNVTLDTHDLPKKEGEEIERNVRILSPLHMPQNSAKRKMKGADFYVYKITIQEGKVKKVIECEESNLNNTTLAFIKSIEQNSKCRLRD